MVYLMSGHEPGGRRCDIVAPASLDARGAPPRGEGRPKSFRSEPSQLIDRLRRRGSVMVRGELSASVRRYAPQQVDAELAEEVEHIDKDPVLDELISRTAPEIETVHT